MTGVLQSASADGVLDLLAAVNRLLERPEDYRAALEPLASLVVPEWSDECEIFLADEGKAPVAAGVSRSGEGVWTIEAPIRCRGELVGVVRLRGADPGRRSVAAALAEELAGRIALAIESANATARERHIAEALQRALLPETLPSNSLVKLDAAYRPASGESTVGGDWYDAFELPDGRIALSIGDVAGHGLSAAVVMGDARQAVRASAFMASTPTEVLARANQMLRTAPMMVTALFGVFDPRACTFTYASAGHPAPLVHLPEGQEFILPSGDMPLGVGEELQPFSWTFTLPPETLLLLYTDGIIEYERDLNAGEQRLFEAVAAEYRAPRGASARAIQERVFQTARNNDDVATMTLYVEPRRTDSFDITFSAVPIAAPYVRASLGRYLGEHGVDSDRTFSVIASVGEAVANAVEHAYNGIPGTVRLRVRVEESAIRVQIEDSGKWRGLRVREERGRGIPMMRALMDRVEIRTDKTSTQIRMQLQID